MLANRLQKRVLKGMVTMIYVNCWSNYEENLKEWCWMGR